MEMESMDLIALLARRNQRNVLERIGDRLDGVSYAHCRLVCKLWASEAFPVDNLVRMKNRRTRAALVKPNKQYSAFLKFAGTVKEVKVVADRIFMLIKNTIDIDVDHVLLEMEASTWVVIAAHPLNGSSTTCKMSAIGNTVVVHQGGSNHIRVSHSSLSVLGDTWINIQSPGAEAVSVGGCLVCSNNAMTSSIKDVMELLRLHDCQDSMSKSSLGNFSRAYITDQHLIVLNTEGVIYIRDLHKMDAVCSSDKVPSNFIQLDRPESVQFRHHGDSLALLVWRSKERMWMWNMYGEGAPRCFSNVTGELLFNAGLLVNKLEESDQRTELHIYKQTVDINVDQSEDPQATDLTMFFGRRYQSRSIRTRPVYLDDKIAISLGAQGDCVFVSRIGPFPMPPCDRGAHEVCPPVHRMLRTRFPFRGIQFVNIECWKNEELRSKNHYLGK